MKLRISARSSELAKIQAFQVGEAIKSALPSSQIEYIFRESLGDKNLKDPLWKIPEKGVFTEDFYHDLKHNLTDMVVHSWKDLPTEPKPDTEIAATLKREDQRDLLLLKKSSLQKNEIRIFSSSPRRGFNIKTFLQDALPWYPQKIEFNDVRGNIQTRLKKLLESETVDGLVLAKAAFDRLNANGSGDTKSLLVNSLQVCNWMILPLRANPNAAAQGALAIEILSNRQDLKSILSKINCEESFLAVVAERKLLQDFGGGCHLALGMSVLQRKYGTIEIIKGKTPQGESISKMSFNPVKQLPPKVPILRLETEVTRRRVEEIDLSAANAFYVSKIEAWPEGFSQEGVVCTAGLETWRKLAKMGVWVNASCESLGEVELPNVESLLGFLPRWGRMTHTQSYEDDRMPKIATYSVEIAIKEQKIDVGAAYKWMSAHEFELAIKKYPELKLCKHVCGPGRTYEGIKSLLGNDENIFVQIF